MHVVIFGQADGELQTLLVFATGMDSIPPLGFHPEPEITFGHPEDLDPDDASVGYPVANTCGNQLRLPILKTYPEFVANMRSALEMALNFFSTV